MLICPCFLTPSVEACTDQTAANSGSNSPQVKVIADLAWTINSIVKKGILSSFLFLWVIWLWKGWKYFKLLSASNTASRHFCLTLAFTGGLTLCSQEELTKTTTLNISIHKDFWFCINYCENVLIQKDLRNTVAMFSTCSATVDQWHVSVSRFWWLISTHLFRVFAVC